MKLTYIPGIKLAVPSTPADAAGLMRSALRDDNFCITCSHKHLYAPMSCVH